MEQIDHVVLFDGVCNLCNSSVDFIIRNDKRGRFKVAPLQSDTGKKLLKDAGLSEERIASLDSVLLYRKGRVYGKSKAALEIAKNLGFPISLLYGFIIIPPFLRDIVYNFIARNRYRWFGKKETCRLPTEEERARFLE